MQESTDDWRGNDKRGLERDRERQGRRGAEDDCMDTSVNKPESGYNERLGRGGGGGLGADGRGRWHER